MSTTIIVFPPGAGGNHLKNIISSNIDELLSIYSTASGPTIHLVPGRNLKKEQIDLALANQSSNHILYGHFGEIMSFQNEIRELTNKKFIILSPESVNDRAMLNIRRRKLGSGYINCKDGDYFDGEQVFLYESFMYHHYFQIPVDNIMNISISEWFINDISSVIGRINYFLKSNLDPVKINQLHQMWVKKNITTIRNII